jgi:hypothetical protein
VTTDDREILSALLDREPVDAEVLAQLLETPANRQLLVDFVRLRTALQPAPHAADAAVWRPPSRPRRLLSRTAAGLALVGLGLGGGTWYARHADDPTAAPLASRIVQLAPPTDQR